MAFPLHLAGFLAPLTPHLTIGRLGLVLLLLAAWSWFTTIMAFSRATSRNLGMAASVGQVFVGLLITGLAVLACPPHNFTLAFACMGLAMAVWTDHRWRLMFDVTTYTTFAMVLISILITTGSWSALVPSLIGAACLAGFLGIFFLVSRGSAMGLGDVKMALSMGAALGGALVPTYLLCMSAVCLCVGIVLLARGKRGEIAFGPYLGLGMGLTILVGSFVPSLLGPL